MCCCHIKKIIKKRGVRMEQIIENRSELDKNEKTWGMLCHLSALTIIFGIPFLNVVAPLVIWLLKKNESAFIDYHGKQSVNFQITVSIITLVCVLLSMIVIGLPLLIAVIVASAVYVITATIKANNGEYFAYKFCVKFIK